VRGAAFVALVLLPAVVFNVWVSPALSASGDRLVPAMGTLGGVLACLAVGSFVVVVIVFRRRVRPGGRE
jgi:hypothetical protein